VARSLNYSRGDFSFRLIIPRLNVNLITRLLDSPARCFGRPRAAAKRCRPAKIRDALERDLHPPNRRIITSRDVASIGSLPVFVTRDIDEAPRELRAESSRGTDWWLSARVQDKSAREIRFRNSPSLSEFRRFCKLLTNYRRITALRYRHRRRAVA